MEDNGTINESSPLIDSRTGKRWNWWERPSEATPKLQHLVLEERRSSIHGRPSNGMGKNILQDDQSASNRTLIFLCLQINSIITINSTLITLRIRITCGKRISCTTCSTQEVKSNYGYCNFWKRYPFL